MLTIKPSVFRKIFWSLLLYVLFVWPAFAAISDSSFLELCKTGSLQQINDAILNGANVNAKDNSDSTPLIYAATFNLVHEVVMTLIKAGADVNTGNYAGWTPLMMAAGNENSNPEIISLFINAGSDVNAKTMEGWTIDGGLTPLMMAAGNNNSNPEVISTLINAGADVNTSNRAGWTPLILAAGNYNSNPEVINTLIKAGANVNARVREDGSTPLVLAAERCSNPEVITILLNFGADAAAKKSLVQSRGDSIIMSAVDLARRNNNLRDTEVIRRLEEEAKNSELAKKRDFDFIELCKTGSLQKINDAIENGANVNARSEHERTPLMLVAGDSSKLEVIITLINAGADVSRRDEYGWTPLMQAASHNSNPEAITIIVKAGAYINANDNAGFTPLMLAAGYNTNPEVITTLLELGADPKLSNKSGRTAIEYARRNRNLRNTDALKKLEDAVLHLKREVLG